MLVRGDLGFPSLVFLVVVVVVPTIVFVVRRKWRHAAARREGIERLLVLASEESARAEFEATEGYCYTSTTTPSSTVTVSASTSASVSLDAPLKRHYECAVCFCPTTTRCAKCKAVRYCSGKCQIIHWRQGHKDECRPYVAVSPINDVRGSGFETKAPHTATLAERFPVNLHHRNDVGVEALGHQLGSNPTSESTFPLSDKGHSYFATPTKSSAGATVGNFETMKSEHHTLVKPARKSTGLGKINQNSNLSDEDTQSGTSSSRTDDGSNESSFSGPSTKSSGFWGGSIRNTKSSINELDDIEPASFGEAANGYMTDLTTKGGYNSTIMNGFNATQIISGGSDDVTGLGGKKSNNDTNLSKEMSNYGSKSRRPPTCNSVMLKPRDGDAGSYLAESHFGESKNSPPGAVSHCAAGAGQHSTLKDTKAFGGLPPPGSERSNHAFSNKSDPSRASNFMEIGSSPSRTTCTYLTTFTSGDASHSTKPVKIDDDNHRVTTFSSQLAENSQSVRSGLRTSKFKVVDQVKPSKSSRHKSLEGGSETPPRYSCKGLFSYEMFVKLYNWKKVELQPCGLKNCGNSCYANAVLQCLVYTPPLTAYLLEGFHSKACDKRGWCFMCEFEGLVLKAKNGNSPLSPIRILTHIENIGSNLGHGREEDAHEFLRYVIDALQSVCIKEAGTNTFNSLEEETTLIGLTFGGYLRSKIKCMRCGGKSERHERMMDLTVEIEGNIRTLEEALDKFTCTEILDGENKYKCSRCKSYEKAKKKLTLLEAPNVLTIALKRFQSGKFGKLNKSILFPEILDMAPYVSGTSDKSPIYRLYGVVVHVDTMNASFSGHYVCYVKNVQNRWFKIDDSMVSEVDLQCVLNKGAYMLLYARCSPRAPRSIRSSLINKHDPWRHKTPASFTSRFQANEPWDACNYHLNFQPQARHRSLEEESSSSSDNSGFFSESCSCSTVSSQRDSSSIEDHVSGDWERDYWNTTNNGGGSSSSSSSGSCSSSGSWRSMNLNSSDSDTSSTSSFPSPLYSRLAHLDGTRTNGISRRRDEDHKECRDCSCYSCRVANLDRLGGQATNPTPKSGVQFGVDRTEKRRL